MSHIVPLSETICEKVSQLESIVTKEEAVEGKMTVYFRVRNFNPECPSTTIS